MQVKKSVMSWRFYFVNYIVQSVIVDDSGLNDLTGPVLTLLTVLLTSLLTVIEAINQTINFIFISSASIIRKPFWIMNVNFRSILFWLWCRDCTFVRLLFFVQKH